jgi:hypothetical protein
VEGVENKPVRLWRRQTKYESVYIPFFLCFFLAKRGREECLISSYLVNQSS